MNTSKSSADQKIEFPLGGHDGPYLSIMGDFIQLLKVEHKGNAVIVRDVTNFRTPLFLSLVENQEEDSFTFSLNNSISDSPARSKFNASSRILAIADIEGNFNALYSLLRSNGVIDHEFNWNFGNNALVLLGDLMDRGNNVTQCLWLIYKLEYQSKMMGGAVHFILGNHELMDLQLDVRYVHEKYIALAQKISGIKNPAEAYSKLLENNTVLVNWIKSKNCIEQIGDTLFVHAGISPEILKKRLGVEEINTILRQFLDEKKTDSLVNLILGEQGPLWYRGLVMDHSRYQKASALFVDELLDFYGVNRIVIGHTIVDEVSEDYEGKVIRIDVKHPEGKFNEHQQALLLEGAKGYRLNGVGNREILSGQQNQRSLGTNGFS